METTTQQTVTRLLESVSSGDASAVDRLLPLVYEELRSMAERHFKRERADHTLQPTALVHEAFLRLVDQSSVQIANRAHFFFLASRAMRNILIDHARTSGRQKRGGGWERVTLNAADSATAFSQPIDLLALNEAMQRLESLDERKARLVELRFFGGLKEDEAADLLGISRSTASEEWRMARAWLKRALSPDPAGTQATAHGNQRPADE